MLTITVPKLELLNEATNQFIDRPEVTFELEHSLAALSKWESEFEIPFIGKDKKTDEQTFAYVRAMTITEGIDPEVYDRLPPKAIHDISTYIDAKMTATWFREVPSRGSTEIITAEIIYYWMVALNIPFECETWHLNKLLTLIKVANQKNQPAKKAPRGDAMAQRRALNNQRLSNLGTTG